MQEWGGSKNWVRKDMPDLATGALNPTWVEWLMGWPLGWTDLKPLETDKSRSAQPERGDCSTM
jgi:DNA (cytosine-5)-methyltransferase 1